MKITRKVGIILGMGALMAVVGAGGLALAWVSTTGNGTASASGPADPAAVTFVQHGGPAPLTFTVPTYTTVNGVLTFTPATQDAFTQAEITATNTNRFRVNVGKLEITSIVATASHATCSTTTHPSWFATTVAAKTLIVPAATVMDTPSGNKTVPEVYTVYNFTYTPHFALLTLTGVTQLSCTGALFTINLTTTTSGT